MSGEDRRKEARFEARGAVTLSVEGPIPESFQAELRDTSRSGFRAAHHHTSLSIGVRVHFYHSGRSGQALVMWNRIVDGHVESGFLVEENAGAD
jgi:hypothetical protein